jgi:hypothetical protein
MNPLVDQLDAEAQTYVKDNYVASLKRLMGNENKCDRLASTLQITGLVVTGIGSAIAFLAGVTNNHYISYASGCITIVAMIISKASSYANSQGNYQNGRLKNMLTEEYQFVHGFLTDPMSLKTVEMPHRPDPMLYERHLLSSTKTQTNEGEGEGEDEDEDEDSETDTDTDTDNEAGEAGTETVEATEFPNAPM